MIPDLETCLAVLTRIRPDCLSETGRREHAGFTAHRSAEEARRNAGMMSEQHQQMRRMGEAVRANAEAHAKEEAERKRDRAAREAAEKADLVTLHHRDGYIREFASYAARQILDEPGTKWSLPPGEPEPQPPRRFDNLQA